MHEVNRCDCADWHIFSRYLGLARITIKYFLAMMFRFSFLSSFLIINSDGVKGNSMKINIYWSEMRSDYNKTQLVRRRCKIYTFIVFMYFHMFVYVYASVAIVCLLFLYITLMAGLHITYLALLDVIVYHVDSSYFEIEAKQT